ncbi:MAG: HsmA family protein [Terrisporobacter sp.]
MNSTLIFAIVTITLALVFYTIGVFGERRAKSLNKNHVIIFWLGLICDTTGTLTMGHIAKAGMGTMSVSGQMLHGVTGVLAIVLMLFHAIWATWVLYKNDEKKKVAFHKFSIVVWVIWLIPYFIGMMLGMGA